MIFRLIVFLGLWLAPYVGHSAELSERSAPLTSKATSSTTVKASLAERPSVARSGTGSTGTVPKPPTVPVKRVPAPEFRGVWIVSAYNLNWPSRPGLSPAAQQAELITLLNLTKRLGLRSVFFQVRPESDALYRSATEPWSRFLTGQQGVDPGYDPLQFACQQAAARGLELHAWLNPFRGAVNENDERARSHISHALRRYAYWVDGVLYLDPGVLAVQNRIVEVVREIVRNYPVRGIHVDDYFYPYPKRTGGQVSFPDDATYRAYRASGGDLSKDDWRRENINRLIQRLSRTVHAERPGTQFSVSPFGIYRPGNPPGVIAQLDQFATLYADPVQWLRQGWVDFLVPQLYWRDEGDQSFSKLLAWWRSPKTNPRQIPVYPGIAIDRLGGSHRWPAREIARQLSITRQLNTPQSRGYALFNAGVLLEDIKGVRDVIRDANSF